MVERLVAEEGDLKGLVLSLNNENETWVIGRDPEECQLVIQDPLTSRKHLIARRTPQGISLENISSTNPIQINDEEIHGSEPHLLQNGDSVKIGNELFRFYTETSAHIVDEDLTSSFLNNSVTYSPPPSAKPYFTHDEDTEGEGQDTIFNETLSDVSLAEINFGLTDVGRWLLKVVNGPNNGAEFYMQTGHTYTLGTDPHTCDIVFQDTSVSRQHARITVSEEDQISIEDLNSRNGVLVSGERLEGKQILSPSVIVTIGTTSFVVYDREGEMQTIISPLLPSIVKVLQHEEAEKEAVEPMPAIKEEPAPFVPQVDIPVQKAKNRSLMILGSIILGLFSLAGIATVSLFKNEPIVMEKPEDKEELIQQATSSFPAVKYIYNKSNDGVLLIGHVNTASDKNQLLYNLQSVNGIKIDDSGIIIDEYVWQEINSVLARNPAWQGINVHSPVAGQFILTGYLKTHEEADKLSDYMTLTFPYLDLLKKQIVVEEEVVNQINSWVQQANLRGISSKITTGEVSLTGNVPVDQQAALTELIQKIKEIPGVRMVNNFVKSQAAEQGIKNISDQYEVTGQSLFGGKYTVIINGRIVSEGDALDGMQIKKITDKNILLEQDGMKYQIIYK